MHHIFGHDWADARTGGKEKVRHIDMAIIIYMSDILIVLVGQGKVIDTMVFFDILNRFIYQNGIDHRGLVYR